MNELIHPGQLQGHTVTVVGAGRSGRAAARLAHALGARVRWLERDPARLDSEALALAEAKEWQLETGAHHPGQFTGTDMVILSPGIPRSSLEVLLPREPAPQVFAEIELASWFVTSPMVGVTGTNGKTTTTMVISRVLEQAGKRIFTGGNIGTPLSEYLLDEPPADVLVLEVSSFQLQNVSSFHPRVGVLLNLSPNHLDYHGDMEEYLEAKLKLFARQNDKDLAVLPLELKPMLEQRGFTEARRVYFVPTDRFDCPGLPGRHNQANLEAAWHACRFFGVDEKDMASALATFQGLPHRLHPLGELGGVLYVDDSKATTLEATQAALESFDRPVLLLAGGVFKGGDPAVLNDLIREKVRSVALFGESREIFEQAWQDKTDLSWDPTLEQAVQRLKGKAESGDVVLLSPATASFDLFKDYKERGLAFKRTVFENGAET